MFHSSIPYGSQQIPLGHSEEFALNWVGKLTQQSGELQVEHKLILQKLNSLLRALTSGDATRITMACSVLSAEAKSHFAKEEGQMLAANYPDRLAHIKQHEELTRSLARIKFSLMFNHGRWSPTSALSMLENWFVPHLTYADRHASDFIATGLSGRTLN